MRSFWKAGIAALMLLVALSAVAQATTTTSTSTSSTTTTSTSSTTSTTLASSAITVNRSENFGSMFVKFVTIDPTDSVALAAFGLSSVGLNQLLWATCDVAVDSSGIPQEEQPNVIATPASSLVNPILLTESGNTWSSGETVQCILYGR